MTIGKFAVLVEAGPCWSDSGGPLNDGVPVDLPGLRDGCAGTGSERLGIAVAALRDDGLWQGAAPQGNGAVVVSRAQLQSGELASKHLSAK